MAARRTRTARGARPTAHRDHRGRGEQYRKVTAQPHCPRLDACRPTWPRGGGNHGLTVNANQQIVAWLRDAHAMEHSLEQVMIRHVAAASDYPEIQERLQQHLDQTRQHRTLVEECLESLGTKPSLVKAVAGGFMGAVEGMSTGVFQDELVKNALADYAMEHFEIACYSALVAAADDAGLTEIGYTCSEILREEVEMADWLEEQIPVLTRMYLHAPAV